jgi:hypothetical protein
MAEGDYPILALRAGEVVPRVEKQTRGGGAQNPSKVRQIERLDPQFFALQRALEAHKADLSTSALGAAPEHVLVFETNGPPGEFFTEVSKRPELEWLLDFEDRVPADADFKSARQRKKPLPPNADQTLTQFVYMILFNQVALEQLLSYWNTYKSSKAMPAGLGAWSGVFRCLRAIHRWGPQDRLREAGLLQDVLESVDPSHKVPVEIELWPRPTDQRRRAQQRLRGEVEAAGGVVLDTVETPEIHYYAMLVELPHGELQGLLRQDVAWLQIDDIYLVRPTPQCVTGVDTTHTMDGPVVTSGGSAAGEPVIALLDGLPMENHPHLQGHLVVDDPDSWGATYQVADRKHGTAMASLILRGGNELADAPPSHPVYVRPILCPVRDGLGRVEERPPPGRLWIDVIHQAVRRMLAVDVPGGPVASSVKIINLSIGDSGRPFLCEVSPLARLLDWLSWKHRVLFVVSAGNHCDDLPRECEDDARLLQHVFANRRHRRLLSPGESLNAVTVGAVSLDHAPSTAPTNARPLPSRPDLPAAYSALGRGHRRSVKPDVLMAGGRQLYQQRLPTKDAPWTPLTRHVVGQLVAVPGNVSSRPTARLAGTSNAAALTSRFGGLCAGAIADVIAREVNNEWLRSVPLAVLIKALMIHTAEWHSEAFEFTKLALADWIDQLRAKDELAGVLGYGVLREERGLRCSPERATAIGGGHISKDMRIRHRVPIPSSLHAFVGWRRVTVTLAWLSPVNSGTRRYRVARLGLDLPGEKDTPLRVKASQVHSDATTRGTVQHFVLERPSTVVNVGADEEFEFCVTCAEDGGNLDEQVPYGLAVSIEVLPGTEVAVYDEVRERLKPRVTVPARVR